MTSKFLPILALAALPFASIAQRKCGSMDQHNHLLQSNPEMQRTRDQIEDHTNRFIKEHANEKATGIVYTIPVVVHVVYRTTAENISDAQVQSQIDVLNEDFRLLNADHTGTPALFAGLKADAEINFCLAKRDPSGVATTGIIRSTTTRTSFGTNDLVKSSGTGGQDAWNSAAYLNLWVCNIGGGILGYAQFPGGPASTDGVVIDYRYFGRNGSAVAPFNKGRTGTHEVGHWLNLYHIWGDDGTACTGTDNVADTPNQADENYGCPTYPTASCSNTSDMYMNYMDYTDDACMFMFSAGQATRMRALFATGGTRSSMTTSQGCVPPSGGTCPVPASLAASSITQTTASLGWGAASGAVSYNIQLFTSTGTLISTTTSTTNSSAITGLTAGTGYLFSVQTVCASGSSAYSAQTSFTTTPSGGVTYCASKGNSQADEWIDRVSLGGMLRTSGKDAGYIYYTTASANVTAGSSYSLGYSAAFTSTAYTEYWRVYIDWNQNGVFTDAGEQMVSRSSSSSANLSTTITVPSTAKNGTTRMRVSMKYGAYGTSCETFTYGEVEDYNVVVSGGVARQGESVAVAVDEESINSQVAVYPNPANTKVYLSQTDIALSEGTQIMMVDAKGRTWVNQTLRAPKDELEKTEVNVENLPNGLYNLIILTQTGTVSKKVLVLHP